MITLSEFRDNVESLHKELLGYYHHMVKSESLITDGIVNLEVYYQCPIRIMWILKEPYGDGCYSIVEDLNTNRSEGKKRDSPRTWNPISYTSYGIQNAFKLFHEMGTINANPAIRKSLKGIAYINVKKLPGRSTTDNSEIFRTYERDKEILLRQIRVYDPNIVIGGNTLAYFKKDLGLNEGNRFESDAYVVFKDRWVVDSKIFIHAHHPMSFKVKQQSYVDDLIKAAKLWHLKYGLQKIGKA